MPDRPTFRRIACTRVSVCSTFTSFCHRLTSRLYRESVSSQAYPTSGTAIDSVPAPQARFSRSRTLERRLLISLPLPLFELTRRLTIYVTTYMAEGAPSRANPRQKSHKSGPADRQNAAITPEHEAFRAIGLKYRLQDSHEAPPQSQWLHSPTCG
jgi:hypothetical protein